MRLKTLFHYKLNLAVDKSNSLICVGLDPDINILKFNTLTKLRFIIEQTKDYVCAYKLNLAFYLAYSEIKPNLLKETINLIPKHIPIILDGKFSDIENTAANYAYYAFKVLDVDAVTVSPYIGVDAIRPFKQYRDKGIFLLTSTTNSSSDFIQSDDVITKVADLADSLDIDVVVGNNYNQIRLAAPESWLLCPGFGAQGKDLDEMMTSLFSDNGRGIIITCSRSVMESPDPKMTVIKLSEKVNVYRRLRQNRAF